MKKKQITYEEEHSTAHAQHSDTLNKLRAGVLGANDGIVSTAGVIMGVVGATNDSRQILIAGIAAVVAGALSMAVGEYVSVSSQSDAEKAFVEREKRFLRTNPDEELDELTDYYVEQGISKATARRAASEVTRSNRQALKAHVKMEMGLDLGEYVNPWSAAFSSLFAFTAGSLVPLLSVLLAPASSRVAVVITAVVVSLCGTGYVSAWVGRANKPRAVLRVVIGGLIAMIVTYVIGHLFGTAVA